VIGIIVLLWIFIQSLEALPKELSAFDQVLDDALARCASLLLTAAAALAAASAAALL
jgi:hypothetical protein